MNEQAYTIEDFRQRAAAKALPLSAAHPVEFAQVPVRSEHELNPGLPSASPEERRWRQAAVLVPIVNRAPASVLLTLRTEHLTAHAGQIGFPGGKAEPQDHSVIETALREAEEEVGLDRAFVEPVGLLETYQTSTGFRIAPVLAVINPGFSLKLDENEVAETFEAPLSFLMNRANHQRHSIEWLGRPRIFYAIPFGERFIWGATAAILRNLYERLYS